MKARKILSLAAAFALFACLVPATSVAAATTTSTQVTVSWLLPVAPTFGVCPGYGIVGSCYSGLIFTPKQTFIAEVSGAHLRDTALLPLPQCGIVQEDVYLINTEADRTLLDGLEASGLTAPGGTPADQPILVSPQWVFENMGDCPVATPSESATESASASASATASESAATPSESAAPSESVTAAPSLTVTTAPTNTTTPPPTGTTRDESGSSGPPLFLFLAVGFGLVAAVVTKRSVLKV